MLAQSPPPKHSMAEQRPHLHPRRLAAHNPGPSRLPQCIQDSLKLQRRPIPQKSIVRSSESAHTRRLDSRPHLAFTPAVDIDTRGSDLRSPQAHASPPRTRRPSSATLRTMRSLRAMRVASQIRRPDTAASPHPHALELRRKQHSHLMRHRRAMLAALHADELLQEVGQGWPPHDGSADGASLSGAEGTVPPSQHVRSAAAVRSLRGTHAVVRGSVLGGWARPHFTVPILKPWGPALQPQSCTAAPQDIDHAGTTDATRISGA